MAITEISGFETADLTTEAITGPPSFTGAIAFSTVQARTGTRSIRINPASGSNGNLFNWTAIQGLVVHFGIFIASMPSVARMIGGTNTANNVNLLLNTDGTISVRNATTVIGTSATALSTSTWYWVGWKNIASATGVLLQVNGVDQVSGTNGSTAASQLGCGAGESSAIDFYIDDLILDNANFLASSKVALLVPISDNAKGTGWTNDAASTTNLFNSVDNTPPIGIADTSSGTGLNQLRNATSNANSNYDANLTTYTTAGVATGDTVLAVKPIVSTAAPVSTSAKQGTVGVSSNPVIANIALGAGGTSGAFWSGNAASTYISGWKVSTGTFTTSPSVTLGSSPVMRITQVTSSTRIAMVCFMGMYVAWTPATATFSLPPYHRHRGYIVR